MIVLPYLTAEDAPFFPRSEIIPCEGNMTTCGHGCLTTDEGDICVCPEGSILQEDGQACTGMENMMCAHLTLALVEPMANRQNKNKWPFSCVSFKNGVKNLK